jgi:[ribosomal protein S18]-alanine N-acetyltransferase
MRRGHDERRVAATAGAPAAVAPVFTKTTTIRTRVPTASPLVSGPAAPDSDFVLELARIADASLIATMSRALIEVGLRWSWTPQRVARETRDRNSNVLVARRDGGIAAFGIMRYGELHAHLNLLAVDPRYRRRGLGRRLMEWLERTAVVAGISEIGLEVRASNAAARRFYGALGYAEVGTLHGYYGGVEAAVGMKRTLVSTQSAPPPLQFPVWPIDR